MPDTSDKPVRTYSLPLVTRALVYLVLFLIGSITTLPLLQPYHVLPISSFYSEWLAIGFGMSVCIVFLSADFWKNFTVPKTSIYLLALAGLIAVQSLLIERTYPAQALLPALYLGWTLLLATAVVWLRERLGLEIIIFFLAWFMLIGGSLQAITGLMQYLNNYGWFDSWVFHKLGGNIVGNVAQSNHFAAHITIAVFALFYLFAKRHVSWTFTFALSTILAITLTLSGSRTVILYAIGVLILSTHAYWRVRKLPYFRFALMSGLFLVLFLLVQYLLPLVNEPLRMLLAEMGFDVSQTEVLTALERGLTTGVRDRLVEWHKAWLMFSQAPLFGVGVGNYAWHSFVLHVPPDFSVPSSVVFHHAHNLFMQVLAELGLAGLLLLVLLIGTWFRQLKNWPTPEIWFILAVLLVLFVHSNLEYPLWYSYFLGITAIFLALGDNRLLRITFSPRLGQAATAISLLLVFPILAVTYSGFRQLASVNALVLETSPGHAARTLQAISINLLLTPWAEAAIATHGTPDKDKIIEQLDLTTRVMRHHPTSPGVYRQTVYLALAGRNEEAIWLLRHAAAAYIVFPEYICNFREYPHKEFFPLISEGEQLLGYSPKCYTETGQSLVAPTTADHS